MTVSVKAPTSTTGSIQLNGSDVLTIDSSGNLTAPNNLTVTGNITGDGSGLTGISAGKVLQVVQARTNATISTSLLVDVASGLTASITPSSVSSKILVSVTGGNAFSNSNDKNVLLSIYRSIGGGSYSSVAGIVGIVQNTTGTNSFKSSWSAEYLDSPSTTSAITYQPYYRQNGTGTGYFNQTTVYVNLTLIEVAG